MIYDINREIYWKIREQDGFNPMKYVCKYMEQHGNLRNKMDLLENMEQLIDLKEDLILHHLDVPDRKLGSMVRINGLFHLLINGVYWGYNPLTNHLLTSWDIQAVYSCFQRSMLSLEMQITRIWVFPKIMVPPNHPF